VSDTTQFVIRTGAITITVDAPPDVIDMLASDYLVGSCKARLHCYPRTREQFDAMVGYAGGPDAFRSPDSQYHALSANGAIVITPPTGERAEEPPVPLPPSLAALRDAQGRDAA
jgi:hypothetical protein